MAVRRVDPDNPETIQLQFLGQDLSCFVIHRFELGFVEVRVCAHEILLDETVTGDRVGFRQSDLFLDECRNLGGLLGSQAVGEGGKKRKRGPLYEAERSCETQDQLDCSDSKSQQTEDEQPLRTGCGAPVSKRGQELHDNL